MGRTPFAADSPTATAARILTQPPDLTGLTGQLRELVAHALEKDPANRPTARELLDRLISGPTQPAATSAALAEFAASSGAIAAAAAPEPASLVSLSMKPRRSSVRCVYSS
jgi:hypothetical protein